MMNKILTWLFLAMAVTLLVCFVVDGKWFGATMMALSSWLCIDILRMQAEKKGPKA